MNLIINWIPGCQNELILVSSWIPDSPRTDQHWYSVKFQVASEVINLDIKLDLRMPQDELILVYSWVPETASEWTARLLRHIYCGHLHKVYV